MVFEETVLELLTHTRTYNDLSTFNAVPMGHCQWPIANGSVSCSDQGHHMSMSKDVERYRRMSKDIERCQSWGRFPPS